MARARRRMSEHAPVESNGRTQRWVRRRRLKVVLLLCSSLLITGIVLSLDQTNVLGRPELDTVDARFAVRGPQTPPKDIVVVGIDDVSFDALRLRFADWPRRFHARLLRNLHKAGVRAVVYDVQFTTESKSLEDDLALYEAAGVAKPVIFATTEVDDEGGTGVFGHSAERSRENLRAIGASVGQALLPDDAGGVVRRMAYTQEGLKALGVVGAEVAEKRRIPPPNGLTGQEWIDFAGPPGTIDTVSFSDVYQGKVPASRLRGKIAVVGPVAPSLQDVSPTSAGGGQMPGAEIQANALATARAGFPLSSSSDALEIVLVVLMGLVAPLANLWLSALRTLLVAVAVGVAYLVGAQIAFQSGTVVPVVAPMLALVLTFIATLVVDYFTETRERRRLRALFCQFVPEAVVDEAVQRADALLGGVELESTVLFSDLRGFTTFAENLPVGNVIHILNHYLGEMSEAILDHGGTLVAYMGDGIMAVFGAPIQMDDHAERAVLAAREMLDVRLPQVNAWLAEEGIDHEFRMGVGLHSGSVMSGNVGSERRMEYTAIGDTTNTAARLEGMTKGSGHQLFVSDATHALLPDDGMGLVFHGELPVRGRTATIGIWVPASDPADEPAAAPAGGSATA
jgi:adenylate cyclase